LKIVTILFPNFISKKKNILGMTEFKIVGVGKVFTGIDCVQEF
jgi:hypothetical protein